MSPQLFVDIFSDVACPWCYIGKRRFEAALAQVDFADSVIRRWHSYQLDPQLPASFEGSEADYLIDAKHMSREEVCALFADVSEQGHDVGLAFDFDSLKVANSFHAHRLIHAAASVGKADELVEGLLYGHFCTGADIGADADLRTMADAAGLPTELTACVLTQKSAFAAAVRDDLATARHLQLSGVPFFIFGQKYGVAGAQPVEVFVDVLTRVWREGIDTEDHRGIGE